MLSAERPHCHANHQADVSLYRHRQTECVPLRNPHGLRQGRTHHYVGRHWPPMPDLRSGGFYRYYVITVLPLCDLLVIDYYYYTIVRQTD